jgi:hypothetical protein
MLAYSKKVRTRGIQLTKKITIFASRPFPVSVNSSPRKKSVLLTCGKSAQTLGYCAKRSLSLRLVSLRLVSLRSLSLSKCRTIEVSKYDSSVCPSCGNPLKRHHSKHRKRLKNEKITLKYRIQPKHKNKQFRRNHHNKQSKQP